MAAPQETGGPVGMPAPAAAPEPQEGDARSEMIAAMVREMKGAGDSEETEEPDEEPEATPEAENAPEKEPEKPKEAEKAEKPAFDLAGARKKVAEALTGLTDEQKAQVFAASSDEFAALHAREKRMKKREAKLVADLTAYEARKRETDALVTDFNEELGRGKENPIAALELFGWTLEDAHAYALNDNTIPHEKRMKLLEERTDKALAERMKALEEHEAKLVERERQANEIAWRNGVSGEVDSLSGSNVRWYMANMPNGKQAVVEAVLQMQRQVFDSYGGQKVLAVQTALDRLERDVADARRVWAADPQREGAVQPANLEAGKPDTRIPSASSGERPRPSNGSEDYDRDDLLREIVAQMRRG